MKNEFLSSRRKFLKTAGASLAVPGLSSFSSSAQSIPNPIIVENAKPGTINWVIANEATNREIEGFASLTSVNRGGIIYLYVNTADPFFTVEIFRLGWYGGLGGRSVMAAQTFPGTKQVIPSPVQSNGFVECNWVKRIAVTTGSTWVSGIYLAKLTTSASKKESWIRFVVRDDAYPSKLLFQSSVTNDQAYNNWGGKSLYAFNSKLAIPALKVSFNRPYSDDGGYGGVGQLFAWEINALRFLEREGYDITYCTNIDTHTSPLMLFSRRAFLSVGHDEYWSYEMRVNVQAARNQGVHLAFLSANTCYWQIRLEPSPITGAANRTMVGYKDRYKQDPFYGVNNAKVTGLWRGDPVGWPEEELLGVQFESYPVNTDMVVDNSSHFIFAGTGLKNGDKLPGLLGYETDRIFGVGPQNIVRLCHSPVNNGTGAFSDMTIYQAASGSYVFATGSMQFHWGLDDGGNATHTPFVNPKAQQMMRNLLARFT
jgi:hypothetical protein